MLTYARFCVTLFAALFSVGTVHADNASFANRPELVRRHAPEAYLTQRQHGVAMFAVGSGPQRAYVFVPQQPTPRAAPVIFFHHGWLGMNPLNFGGMIDLLVRRGAVVIYPVYQDGNQTSPQVVTQLAAEADGAAWRALRERFPGLADPAKTLYFGFSMGAAISVNLALDPAGYGLPPPRALLLIAPGDAYHVAHGSQGASIYGKVENLPADLPTVLVSGLADTSIGVPTARKLAARLCHLQRRSLLLLPSDADGDKQVTAGHGSPGAPDNRYNFPDPRKPVAGLTTIPPRADFEPSGSLNLLDFYGYWRLTTRLLDFAQGLGLPEEVFADTAENRFLGLWPSGKAYAAAQFEDPCR